MSFPLQQGVGHEVGRQRGTALRQPFFNGPFPNPAGHFHGTVALQNSLSVCTKVLRPIQANLGLSDEFL